jgi:hypothetical protein
MAHSLSSKLQVITAQESEREREKSINSFRCLAAVEETPRSQLTEASFRRLSQDSGLKRKRSGSLSSSDDDQQRKKVKVKSEPLDAPRLTSSPTPELADPLGAALDIWWKAMESNSMLGGGIPSLLQPETYPNPQSKVPKEKGIGTGKRKRIAECVHHKPPYDIHSHISPAVVQGRIKSEIRLKSNHKQFCPS